MDYEKLTNRSKDLIQDVVKLAASQKHQYISPEHLLQALIDDKSGLIADLINKSGGSLIQIRNQLSEQLSKVPQVMGEGTQSLMSQDFTRVMLEAEKLADKANDKYVTLERILQALALTDGTPAYRILKDSGVDAKKLNQVIND